MIMNKTVKKYEDLNFGLHQTDKKNEYKIFKIEVVNNFNIGDMILDIRSVDEQNNKPLKVNGIEIVLLPFYNLKSKFCNLDQSKTWLLWCEYGVMSRLQALYLREQGFFNVKVYLP